MLQVTSYRFQVIYFAPCSLLPAPMLFAHTYPLVRAHCRLYPQVFPVISNDSPIKYSQGIFLDWKCWSRFFSRIHPTDTFASWMDLNALMLKSRTVSPAASFNFWMTFLLVQKRSKSHWMTYFVASWSIYKVASKTIGQLNHRCVKSKGHLLLYIILSSAYNLIKACTVFHANREKSSFVSMPHNAACGAETGSHNCSAIS